MQRRASFEHPLQKVLNERRHISRFVNVPVRVTNFSEASGSSGAKTSRYEKTAYVSQWTCSTIGRYRDPFCLVTVFDLSFLIRSTSLVRSASCHNVSRFNLESFIEISVSGTYTPSQLASRLLFKLFTRTEKALSHPYITGAAPLVRKRLPLLQLSPSNPHIPVNEGGPHKHSLFCWNKWFRACIGHQRGLQTLLPWVYVCDG